MKIGDFVKVHWGNCNREGDEDVEWGYSTGVVMEEIVWWDPSEPKVHPCGDVLVLERGQQISYNIGRCEVIA